jgi:hypothetical protein
VELLVLTTRQQGWTTGSEIAYRSWTYSLLEEEGNTQIGSTVETPPVKRRRLGPASFSVREYKHETRVHAALNSLVPGVEWERAIRHAKIRHVLQHPVRSLLYRLIV